MEVQQGKINTTYVPYNIVDENGKAKQNYKKVTGLRTNAKYSFAVLVVEYSNPPLSAWYQKFGDQVRI